MQTQWAKANISSETKNTPFRSLGGNFSHYLREVFLTEGLFKAMSKLGAVPSCWCAPGHDQSLESVCVFTEERCKAEDSSHNTTWGWLRTEHAIMTMLSLSQPGLLLMGSRG